MRAPSAPNSLVDGLLHWQCVCICANPQHYAPRAIERLFLERVIRAYASGRRLRDTVQSTARGIVAGCKERRRSQVSSSQAPPDA